MTDITDAFRWASVELRHLITLQTVAGERSLAGAARRLGYSQPAISQQLAAFERIVGARLVERRAGGREVALTDAGERVLVHGAAILARARAADGDLRALERGTVRNLRLGTFPSVGARIVPPLLRRFAADWPEVDVALVEAASDRQLLKGIEAAELELAFAMLPLEDGPFAAVEVLRDPYVLLVAADSPLAASGHPLSLHQIRELPLIGFRHGQAYPEAFLGAHGIVSQVRFRTDDNETLAGLVAAGLGAALVPQLTVNPERSDVVRLELATKLPPRRIAIAWHCDREQSEAALALVELARALGGELARR